MEFKKDYSYLYLTKNEYTEPFINEVVKSIRFYGTDKFEEEYSEIKEWLEENFIMYQYKNNGIEYGEHELFYWSDSYHGNGPCPRNGRRCADDVVIIHRIPSNNLF